jgi:hypothetical protein
MDTKDALDKMRIIALTRGYSYAGGKSKEQKIYVHRTNDTITLMLNENKSKGYVEVLYFQNKEEGFDDFAEKEFNALMSDINEVINENSISFNIPFTKGKPAQKT